MRLLSFLVSTQYLSLEAPLSPPTEGDLFENISQDNMAARFRVLAAKRGL